MKYIKIYESNFSNKDEKLTKKYKDKFFIAPVYMREYDWKKEDFYIVLVNSIEIRNNPEPRYDSKNQLKPHIYWPRANNFTVMKNGEIKDAGGWGHDYTEEDFNEIEFMTAQEFYNKNPELCEKLYWKVLEVLKTGKCADWYCKMCKDYERVLGEVEELKYIKNSEKYNL